MESPVESVSLGENNRVTAVLRPPLALGYLTTEPGPKGRRPQVPELRVRVEYNLAAYCHAGVHGSADAQAPAPGTRYSLAAQTDAAPPGEAEHAGNRPRVAS